MDTNSEGLVHILEFVMKHQNAFSLPLNRGRQGLLQIQTPTPEESTAAAVFLLFLAALRWLGLSMTTAHSLRPVGYRESRR